jgi:adenylate cyclase
MHYYGRFEESISLYKKAYRLNPKILPIHLRDLAMSYIFLERYEEALEVIRQMEEHIKRGDAIPKSMPLLFYSWVYQELDRKGEASAYMAEALEINPNLSIEFVKKNTLPYKNQAHLKRTLDAYRKAGMPENPPLPLPDKPSIAVLPFTNMSGDPEQDYIGDGLSENIISALSISSKLFVIARNSTFTYKGKPVKVQHVARDLGVQYVLEGSVQKSGERLRVTAQLIDAIKGHHLWSAKYDRKMEDLFGLQDEITKKIVVELQVELTEGEFIRALAKSTDNLEAWILYIKGLELFWNFNEESNAKAREHFEAATKLDPEFVTAFAMLSSTHRLDAVFGWSDSPIISLKRAFELLQIALKIDEQNAHVHALLGWVYLSQRQLEKAITEGTLAITLNPNFSVGHATLAATMFRSGRFDEAITLIKKAYRLDQKLPPLFLSTLSSSYIFLGRYDEALEVINQMKEQARRGNLLGWIPPLYYSFVYQELGREEEARAYMAEALKSNPGLSLEWIKKVNFYKNPAHLQRQLDAYRKAGMPEKPPGAVP